MGRLIVNHLHHLLKRQIEKSGLEINNVANINNWQKILNMISSSYCESDQERYLLERSLTISSKEMQDLNKKMKKNADQWVKDISNTYPDMLLLLSEDGIVLDLLSSRGFENLLINPNQIDIQQPIEFILEDSLSEILRTHIDRMGFDHNNESFEYVINEFKKNIVYEIRLIATDSKSDTNLFCLIRDISDLAESKIKLEHLAHHDSLTGLANRLGYYKKLNSILEFSEQSKTIGGVLFFDLDRFKSINDSLGHRIGDQLIVAVSKRISGILHKNEFFARVSGDEFNIVIYDIINENKIPKRAKALLRAFDEPFQLATHKIEVKASVGISLFPKHGMNSDILTQFADTAMYSAKEMGGNQYVIFNEQQNSRVRENFQIEQGLRRAIEREEIQMVYQSQHCVKTNATIGYEALVRWKPHGKPPISPMRFIPIAELTGIIDDLGLWIINDVFKQINAWKKSDFNFINISINLSRVQLLDPNLVKFIIMFMKSHHISYSDISFEITEDSIISNNKVAMDNLISLHDLGIKVSIDDFGTGYSSFFDLQNFPFSDLKIDKSIIDGIGKKNSNDTIIRAIIAIGKEMNMQIIAEGVETQEQLEFLKNNQCNGIQGYIFSEPMKVSELS